MPAPGAGGVQACGSAPHPRGAATPRIRYYCRAPRGRSAEPAHQQVGDSAAKAGDRTRPAAPQTVRSSSLTEIRCSQSPSHRRCRAPARPKDLHVAIAQGEAEIQLYRVLDNPWRKPMSAVGERGHAVILSHPETHSNPVSVTMPAFPGLIPGEATSTGEMRPLCDNRTAICHWPCARGTRRGN